MSGVDHETIGELHRLGTSGAQFAGDDNLASLGSGLHDETEDSVARAARGEKRSQLGFVRAWVLPPARRIRQVRYATHEDSISTRRPPLPAAPPPPPGPFENSSLLLETRFRSKGDSPTDGKTSEELVPQALALGDGIETTVLDLLGVKLDATLGELEPLLDEGSELADAASLLSENLLRVGGADDDLGAGVGDANLAARVSLRGEGAREELGELGAAEVVVSLGVRKQWG